MTLASALVRSLSVIPPEWLRWASGLRYRLPFLQPIFRRAARVIRNRDLTIQHGPAAGLRFNCGNSMAGYVLGYMEPHIQNEISRYLKPGMVAYDLGANVGFLSTIMARLVGPTGQIVSFEPNAGNAAQIRHNARLNGFDHLIVREEAVGDHDGEESLQVAGFSGNHRMSLVGTEVLDPQGTATVQMRALDSVVRESPEIRPPNLIKMDIEGAEVMALRGAAELLARVRPTLVIELHGTARMILPVLRASRYEAHVLADPASGGRAHPLTDDAHWNAHIVCTPIGAISRAHPG